MGKKSRRVNPVLIGGAVAAIVLSAIPTVLAGLGVQDILRTGTELISTPIRRPLDRLGDVLEEKYLSDRATAEENRALAEENERLRAELSDAVAELAHAQSAAKENRELREMMALTEQYPTATWCEARISGSAEENGGWFSLDVGLASGVRRGMPVVCAQGLLGTVAEVGMYSCKVLPVTDASVSVGAMVAASGEPGVVTGSGNGGIRLGYLNQGAEVAVGDRILTGGQSDRYPAGLLIGTVYAVGQDPYDRSWYAEVEPAASAGRKSTVLVILSFEEVPADAGK